jgi:hypothetical protein
MPVAHFFVISYEFLFELRLSTIDPTRFGNCRMQYGAGSTANVAQSEIDWPGAAEQACGGRHVRPGHDQDLFLEGFPGKSIRSLLASLLRTVRESLLCGLAQKPVVRN